MQDVEKRGTGMSLFGGKNWAKRTVSLSNGKLSYSLSAADMAAGKIKKTPVALEGYSVLEPTGPPAGITELHLVRDGFKTICLCVLQRRRRRRRQRR